jgi:hypothetical protein
VLSVVKYELISASYTNEEKKTAYFAKFNKPGQYDLNASGVIIENGLYEKVYQRILIKQNQRRKRYGTAF